MAKKTTKNIKEKAVEAALDLAAQQGWEAVTLQAIARRAKVPLHELHDHFADRYDIIAAWSRIIDHRVLQSISATDQGTTPRDQLFDLLMERLDILNEQRDGATAVLSSFKCDPKQAAICLPCLCRSMGWMLDAAGIETGGLKGVAKIAGLTAIYLRTLWVWRDDDSPDMAKTMAALDQALGHAEGWTDRFGFAN